MFGRSRYQGHERRSPGLTLLALAALILLGIFLVQGGLDIGESRITIDLPFVDVNGAGAPDIEVVR